MSQFHSYIEIYVKVVADKGVNDTDSVSLRYLDQLYGIPCGSVKPGTNLSPQIPIFFVKNCNRGDKYALNLPVDTQSRLAACLVVLKSCRDEINSNKWVKGYNSIGVKYGDKRFINLPTFKT